MPLTTLCRDARAHSLEWYRERSRQAKVTIESPVRARNEVFARRRNSMKDLAESRILAGDPGGTAAATVSGLVGVIRRFVGEEPQSDDIAVIALRRTW